MKLTKTQLKQLIKEAMIEEGFGDWLKTKTKQALNMPGRVYGKAANAVYDLTAPKDVPSLAIGDADKVSKMEQPWEYKEATEDEKTKFDVAMAIAGILSLGAGAAAAGGAGAKQAMGKAALKQYMTDRAIDAPAIAAGTYAAYQLAVQKTGNMPVNRRRFEAAKAALKSLAMDALPGKNVASMAAKTIGTVAN